MRGLRVLLLVLFLFEIGLKLAGKVLEGEKETWEKEEGKFRILAVGESYVFGLWIGYENSWAKQLERMLEECCRKLGCKTGYSVKVAGGIGYNSSRTLEVFRRAYESFEPHVVLLQVGANDINWDAPDDVIFQIAKNPLMKAIAGAGFLLEHLTTFRVLRWLLCSFAPCHIYPLDTVTKALKTNLTAMIEIAKESKVFLVTYLVFVSSRGKDFVVLDVYREISREFQVPVVNVMTERKELLHPKDSFHPTRKGARYIAEKVLEAIGDVIPDRKCAEVRKTMRAER